MIGWALGLAGLLLTVLVGLPLVDRWGHRVIMRRPAPRDPAGARVQDAVRVAFEPLDLGPDPILWPSEVDRPDTGPKSVPWPSETWDDPHFGKQWKATREAADAALRRVAPQQRGPAPRADREPSPAPATPRAEPTRAPPDTASPRVPAPSAARPAASDRSPPAGAELQELVAGLGLAGTVQEIMRRTGWDFRKAAQYLAQQRSR